MSIQLRLGRIICHKKILFFGETLIDMWSTHEAPTHGAGQGWSLSRILRPTWFYAILCMSTRWRQGEYSEESMGFGYGCHVLKYLMGPGRVVKRPTNAIEWKTLNRWWEMRVGSSPVARPTNFICNSKLKSNWIVNSPQAAYIFQPNSTSFLTMFLSSHHLPLSTRFLWLLRVELVASGRHLGLLSKSDVLLAFHAPLQTSCQDVMPDVMPYNCHLLPIRPQARTHSIYSETKPEQ